MQKKQPKYKRKNPRYFTGNIPEDGKLIGESADWKLFSRASQYGFTSFKLISIRPRAYKANFFFHINMKSGLASRSSDVMLLEKRDPDVWQWCCDTIIESLNDMSDKQAE